MFDILISDYPVLIIFLAGSLGAFIADIFKDNCLDLPRLFEGKLFLGWIGGALIGGFAGVCIDGSFLTALMGGFMGKEVISRLSTTSLQNLK